ncbi:MAG: DUF2157 domain-containing protein [Waterburya sp.]
MVSEKFRHQLQKEVEKWQAEGLIGADLSQQLAQRYQFNNLEISARNRFVVILITFGSILLGLAAITFVAANWQVWSREFKVLLLVSVFVGINIAGFYLWRNPTNQQQQRLGQGLLLLGALLLGANMGLMSQMFHQTGMVYQLFLTWGIAVLAMAYCLNLTSLSILSLILVGIGYGLKTPSNWGAEGEVSRFQLIIEYIPLLISLLFIPLAYRCRSNWLFALSTCLIIYSFLVNLSTNSFSYFPFNKILIAIGYCLPVALLWGYSDRLWTNHQIIQGRFDSIARNLAIFCLSILFYLSSFHGRWDNSWSIDSDSGFSSNLINIIVLLILTIYTWWKLGYKNSSFWKIDRHSTAIAIGLIISASLFWYQANDHALGAITTTIFNLMLLLLAIELIREALAVGNRGGFWSGIILLVLQICSRMLEYNTDLLLKAIVLFLCGIGIIFAGLWFERYVQTLTSANQE